MGWNPAAMVDPVQAVCLSAATLKAGSQAPFLPANVTLPLDSSCSPDSTVAR